MSASKERNGAKTAAGDDSRSADKVKIIKRYTNRKLYDTVESRYVTLEEIAEMIRTGGDVRIIDNRSKEDLTSVTLAQIIFEQEKKKARMPLDVLKNMVRSGGDTLQDFISREIQPRVATIREEAEQRMPRVFRKGERQDDGQDAKPAAEEVLSTLKASVEEWQRWIDTRVHDAASAVSFPALQTELERLRTRLEEMRQRVVAGKGQADDPQRDPSDPENKA